MLSSHAQFSLYLKTCSLLRCLRKEGGQRVLTKMAALFKNGAFYSNTALIVTERTQYNVKPYKPVDIKRLSVLQVHLGSIQCAHKVTYQ